MPYIDRAPQLWNTLLSYVHFYKGRQDFEIIIIEDPKQTHEQRIEMTKVVKRFSNDLFIRVIPSKTITYNPASHYNLGVDAAWGKFIILTNPECMHSVDVLKGFEYHDNEGYIICSCRNRKSIVDYPQTYEGIILQKIWGEPDWYHHSKAQRAPYHWCTQISKENYLLIGGFDEKYSDGIAFEDLDFLDKVRRSRMRMHFKDNLITVHQQHNKMIIEGHYELTMKNKDIYDGCEDDT